MRGGPKGDKGDLSPVQKMPPRGSDPLDPMCLADTGIKCGVDAGGVRGCNAWVACSDETYTCTCHHWGCADSDGQCRPIKNQWYPEENRLMPIAAAKPGEGHRFVTMKNATNHSTPRLQDGWPNGTQPESIWKFLIMNDNATILITTKQGVLKNEGQFLALPPAPWQKNMKIDPIWVKPQDALQASWRVVERPRARTAVQHVSSGRFLCYDDEKDALSTCAETNCKAGTTDFEVYPKLAGLYDTLKSKTPKLPKDGTGTKKSWESSDPVKEKNTSIPWYLRKNNSQARGPLASNAPIKQTK